MSEISNRPHLYSRNWTGTPHEPRLQASSSPKIPKIRISPISNQRRLRDPSLIITHEKSWSCNLVKWSMQTAIEK